MTPPVTPTPSTRFKRRLRWAVIILGLTIFVWMGFEDNHVWPVTFLGTCSATLAVLVLVEKYHPTVQWSILTITLIGTATGLTTAPATAFLMFMKNAQHAHLFPDFPPAQIGAVLARAPVWTAVGALMGYGIGRLWQVFRESSYGRIN